VRWLTPAPASTGDTPGTPAASPAPAPPGG
jgi:hypothetical protein